MTEVKNDISSDLIKDKEILSIIKNRLSVRKEEKDLYGEVLTPIELIYEMFYNLPKSVWTNPDLKWLDPSNGIGNFPLVVYYKLFKSLKTKIPDSDRRSKHIIENMLFMVELNPVNIHECEKIFKLINNKAKPNIIKHDFLTFDSKKSFEIDNFDVIMGNPPFSKKVGQKKNQRIWNIFVKDIILKFLKKDGYLILIHPGGWRNISGNYRNVYDLIMERDLISLTMRNYKWGSEIFKGTATNYDHYILKNTFTKKNKTIINDIDKNDHVIDLNNYDFIPGGAFNIFEKLRNKGNNKIKIIYSGNAYETRTDRSKHPTSDKENKSFKYPIIYSITKKKGIKLFYSSEKDDKIFVPKVVWSNGIGTYPIVDLDGSYGLTQFSYGISDLPKNLNDIKKALEHPEFIKLMSYVKFTENKYNYKIIGTFEPDFYKFFLSGEK